MGARLWPGLERCPEELAGSYSEQTLSHRVSSIMARLLRPRLSSLSCTFDLYMHINFMHGLVLFKFVYNHKRTFFHKRCVKYKTENQ